MKTRNWLLGAATGAILIGSLVGVGCKSSSNSSANATKTAQAKVTPAKTTTSVTPHATGTKAAATGTLATTSPTSTASPTLVPAESQGPAAAACDPQPGTDAVTFSLVVGIPQPRCAQAAQNQHVRLVNNIGQSVTITFAGRTITIADGSTQDINDPVGTYLAPGVHVAHVDYYGGSGPEVWVPPYVE